MKSVIIFLILSFVLLSKPFYGVWLRPAEKPKELIKQIQNIKKAGFDAIFLETFYHGYVITPNTVFPHRPSLNGIDLLEIAAKECKRQKLELHVWFETFYWRVDTSLVKGFPYSPLLNDLSIAARLKSGELTGKSEFAHDFVNPLHPKVRYLLSTYVKQIIARYKIEGIHFDYIRYHAGKEHSGYDSLTLFTFYNETKIDAKSIKKDGDEWRVWCLWRENVVTNFVKEISDTIRKVNPKIKISAAVFGEYYKERYINSKLQDWATWCKFNYIDFLTPMIYSSDIEIIKNDYKFVKDTANNLPVYAGIASPKKTDDIYGSPKHPSLEKQIKELKKLKVDGIVIFCWNWMEEFYSKNQMKRVKNILK